MDSQMVNLVVPVPANDPAIVGRVLQAVGEVLTGADGAAVAPERAEIDEAAASPYSGNQGEANLARFADAIAPKARWLLRQIANDFLASGEARARTIRRRAGDVHEGALGGWVGSITSAARHLDLPKPYSNDYQSRHDGWQNIYWMETEVAEVIQRLIDEDGNLKGIVAAST